ncbi:MAG: trypsin-like serine protease, partial [Tepidisphaeraceae bacterium]
MTCRVVKLTLAATAAVTAACFSPHAFAGAIRHDRNDADYVALGNDPKYAAVGSITWFFGLARGSGTLISPRWVLTAAHVVDSADTRTFRAGGTASNNGTAFTGAQNIFHESWSRSDILAGFDVGLLRLSSPVTAIVPASRFSASDEVGRVGTSVGFGIFGTGAAPPASELNSLKRGGTNMIDVLGAAAYAGASDNLIAADFDDPGNADGLNSFGSADPLNLEYCVSSGDSGGGVFVDVGARSFVAGIHSFVEDPFSAADDDSGYRDTFGSSRISTFNAWIDDKMSRNWNNPAGGAFATGGNWIGGLPDQYDVAGFNTGGTYTVTIAAPTISHRLISRNGNVTLNLGGSTYTLTSFSYEGSLIVGRYGGNASSLTITNGILTTRETVLAEQPLSSGTLTIGVGATWNVVGDVYAGGNFIAPGGNGTLLLNPGSSTTITGKLKLHLAGTLHLGGGSFSSALLDLAGGTIATSAPATLSMPITTAANVTVTKSGAASLTITGAQTHGANTTLLVSAGMLNLNSNAGSGATANLSIEADSAVHFGATQNLRALDIASGVTVTLAPGGTNVIKTSSLLVAATAKLDVGDNKLIVAAGDLSTWNGAAYTGITGLIDAGRGNNSNAQWNGVGGIVTTDTRAVNNNDLCSIGVAAAGQLGRTTFAGQTVDAADALAMFTWGGDANLDGKINIDDYGQIDFN